MLTRAFGSFFFCSFLFQSSIFSPGPWKLRNLHLHGHHVYSNVLVSSYLFRLHLPIYYISRLRIYFLHAKNQLNIEQEVLMLVSNMSQK